MPIRGLVRLTDRFMKAITPRTAYRGLGRMFVGLLLANDSSAAAASMNTPPGPGTAITSQSDQSVRMPLLMPDDFSFLHLVAWRVEYGTPDAENPLLEGVLPWDSGGVGIHSSIFKDPLTERWKAYLVCTPPEETNDDWRQPWNSRNDSKRRLCVFDSADGVHWKNPELSEVSFGEHKTTNILFRLDQGTAAYSSIMIDGAN